MEFGDLCPWCLDADCPSTAQTCPGLAKPAAEAPVPSLGPIEWPHGCAQEGCGHSVDAHASCGRCQADDCECDMGYVAPPGLCGWCFGAGGYRVPCHGCKVVGPVMVAR